MFVAVTTLCTSARAATSSELHALSEDIIWCADPRNHEVDAAAQDAQARALTTFRRCGFAKLRRAIEPEALLQAGRYLHGHLRAAPDSPLLAILRPSLPPEEAWPSDSSSWLASLWPRAAKATPWLGSPGRAMLDVPCRHPANASELSNGSAIAPLVRALLGDDATATSLGVTVEQAACTPPPTQVEILTRQR